MPEQLKALGLDVVRARGETALFSGSEPDDPARDVYRMTFDIVLPDLVGKGFLSQADGEEACALFDNPDIWLMGFCFFATLTHKPVTPTEPS